MISPHALLRERKTSDNGLLTGDWGRVVCEVRVSELWRMRGDEEHEKCLPVDLDSSPLEKS